MKKQEEQPVGKNEIAGDGKEVIDEKEIVIDMPEVKDIPGQEHIKPPHIKEMMDITVSSADEEGEGLLDDLNKEEETDELSGTTTTLTDVEVPQVTPSLQADRSLADKIKDADDTGLNNVNEDDVP